jgi:ATP-dependent DNA helicase RecG
MRDTLLTELIAQGESERVEFAAGLDDKTLDSIGATVASFLNSEGGTLVLGIGKQGEVQEISNAPELASKIRRWLEGKVSPSAPYSVVVEELAGKPVIVIDVPRGLDTPHVYGGRISVRQGARSVVADREHINKLIEERQYPEARWERLRALGCELWDLDADEIEKIRSDAEQRHSQSTGATNQAFLTQLNLLENGVPRNSAVVLFARRPQALYAQTRVRLVRFGQAPGEVLDSRVLEGHAFSQVREIHSFLRSHMPVSAQLPAGELKRRDAVTIPWRALREGLMNALIHRDYEAFHGGVSISLYPDRVEIWNSGVLPEGLTIDDIKRGSISRPRNPDMAHVFYLRGLIERLGIGGRLIVHECREAGLPEPEWELVGGGVLLTLWSGEGRPKEAAPVLNARQAAFLRQAAAGDELRVPDYHQRFAPDLSERRARLDLAELVEAGYLSRLGRARATVYLRTAQPFP